MSRKGRETFRGTDASGTFPVEYRFTNARNGNRHLVVVFANFFAPEELGWSNGVLDRLRSNILWIRDRFDGQCSYYLCKDMDFAIEESVAGLIGRFMQNLGIGPADVTVFGSSKGGSAALYYGMRYGLGNIVAIAPQFRIGSYVHESHPAVAQYMLGQAAAPRTVQAVDSLIPELLRRQANRSANIYLFSSPADEQYEVQVKPFLPMLREYENFNFFFTDSPFVTRHNQVAVRNVPVILGIVSLLVDGLAPRIGMVRNGFEEPKEDRSPVNGYLEATAGSEQRAFGAPVVSDPAPGAQVSGANVRFVGAAHGAVKISFWENAQHVGSAPVSGDGSWRWTPAKPWAPGHHLVKAFCVDAKGTQSARTVVEFTVHGTLAAPVVAAPRTGQQVPAGGVRFEGIAQGAVRVEFWEDGQRLGWAGVAPDGRWGWVPGAPWPEGQHTVKVFAVDATGSDSERAVVEFAVGGHYVQPQQAPRQPEYVQQQPEYVQYGHQQRQNVPAQHEGQGRYVQQTPYDPYR